MEVHLAAGLQHKVDELVSETGLSADKLIEDALANYFADLAETRLMLDSRYDALKSGRVKAISGDEFVAHFRRKSVTTRKKREGHDDRVCTLDQACRLKITANVPSGLSEGYGKTPQGSHPFCPASCKKGPDPAIGFPLVPRECEDRATRLCTLRERTPTFG